MNINDSIPRLLPLSPGGSALVPVGESALTKSAPEKQQAQSYPQAVLASTKAAREGIQARAEMLMQRNLVHDALSGRNRMAIASYRALEESEEREKITSILGVDEYA